MPKMELNKENYHSIEANREFFSVSQFKDFESCEAKAMAQLNGEHQIDPPNEAMIVGSYIHSYFESVDEHKKFQRNHYDDIYKLKKDQAFKKEPYLSADEMIRTIKKDRYCMLMLNGDKEVVLTFEWCGVVWKMRVDNLNLKSTIEGKPAPFFSDIKSCKQISEKMWSPVEKCHISFVEAWMYHIQMAVYKRGLKIIYGVDCEPYIIAVSKQDPPDKAIIDFEDWRLSEAENYVIDRMKRFIQVKKGLIEPHRCEKCDYCRTTKVLSAPISVGELIYV